MEVDILVIKKDVLFKENDINGFVSIKDKDFLPLLREKSEYQLRNAELEKNPTFKQIIPYLIVVNPKNKTVFGYKRFKKAPGFHETRLHDKFSIGLGGHVDKVETQGDLIDETMMREFKEEVKMDNYPTPKVIGFLNVETTEVDRMHFAIVAIAETSKNVEKRENDEVTEEKFYNISEVDSIMQNPLSNMDNWTRVVWPEVKKYLFSN